MRRKVIFILVCSMMMTVFLSGCTTFDSFKEAFFQDKNQKEETIRIGVLEPQSGDDKESGQLEIEGIELANKLYGNVLDKKVELIYADTQSSIYSAESAVADLISKEPAVVLGSYGDAVTLVASSVLRQAKIPAIGITTVNPLITGGNEYYFKVGFSESSQGRALANFVYEKLKLDSVGIIKLKDEETTSEMITQFTRTFTKLTGKEECIAVNVDIDPVEKNYTEALQTVKDSGVKTVFVPTSLKVAERIFEAADKLKMDNVLFIGTKDWHNEELLKLQVKYPKIKLAAVSDVLSENKTDSAGEVTKKYNQFVKAYQKQYGDVEPPEETALAFDAYMLAITAIQNAGSTDHEKVREALATTQNYQGVSGSISFNGRGEPHKLINVDYVDGTKFTSIYTVKQQDTTDLKKDKKGENNNGTEN